MPTMGTLDVAPRLAQAPQMPGLDGEPLCLPGAEVLHLLFEIACDGMEDMVPPALSPTLPPVLSLLFYRCPQGPPAPFQLAQVRLGCRAGVRARTFLVHAASDEPRAAALLAERWGLGSQPARLHLDRGHHAVSATVERDGRSLLEAVLRDPEPISGSDVHYNPSLNLARVGANGGRASRLVQLDPSYTFHRADRGRPELVRFDAEALGDARIRPSHPISATFCLCDVTLPRIRYVCDPERPAFEGTERVNVES